MTKVMIVLDFELFSNEILFLCIEQELHAPTLLSVRKRTASTEMAPSEEKTVGDDEEEDPIDANLEQDEAETEAETQRKLNA